MNANYVWSAVYSDGTVRDAGGDIAGASAVIFSPTIVGLPEHCLIGLPFIRRFGRGFLYGLGGGMKDYAHCVVTEFSRIYVLSKTGAMVITPVDYELYL